MRLAADPRVARLVLELRFARGDSKRSSISAVATTQQHQERGSSRRQVAVGKPAVRSLLQALSDWFDRRCEAYQAALAKAAPLPEVGQLVSLVMSIALFWMTYDFRLAGGDNVE